MDRRGVADPIFFGNSKGNDLLPVCRCGSNMKLSHFQTERAIVDLKVFKLQALALSPFVTSLAAIYSNICKVRWDFGGRGLNKTDKHAMSDFRCRMLGGREGVHDSSCLY